MRVESELLLELSRRKPNRERATSLIASEDFDWDFFLHACSRNMVRLFVLDKLDDFELPHEVRHKLASYLFVDEQRVAARRQMMSSELQRIGIALRGANIPFVLMKGASLDYSDLREFGDMDLLVQTNRLVESVQLLGTLDYEFEGSPLVPTKQRRDQDVIQSQLAWNNQFEVYNPKVGLLVELHTNLFHREGAYVEDLDQLWAGIDIFWEQSRLDQRLGCNVFSSEGLLLLMCLHVAIKRSPARNTFCLRNLIDIDRLCKPDIRWDRIVEDAAQLGVSALVYFSLDLSQALLGTQIPAHAMAALRANCHPTQLRMCRLHRRCLVGLDGSAPLPSLAYRVASPFVFGKRWSDRLKWILLIPILFPSRFDLAARFGLEESSPWLPLCYPLSPFQRLFSAISRLLRP